MRQIFTAIAPVSDVRICISKETGQSKGFAFVEFEDNETCLLAIKHLHGTMIGGRPIRIDFCSPEQARMFAQAQQQQGGGGPTTRRDPQIRTNNTNTNATDVYNLRLDVAAVVDSLRAPQLLFLLHQLQTFARRSPERLRSLLRESPTLAYAILHAQLLIGMYDKSTVQQKTTEMPVINRERKLEQLKDLSRCFKQIAADQARASPSQEMQQVTSSSQIRSSGPVGTVGQQVGPVGTTVGQQLGQQLGPQLPSQQLGQQLPGQPPPGLPAAGQPPPPQQPRQQYPYVNQQFQQYQPIMQQLPIVNQQQLPQLQYNDSDVEATIETIMNDRKIFQSLMSVTPEQEAQLNPLERAELNAVREALRARGVQL